MHGDVATMLRAFRRAVDVTFEAVEFGVFYDQLDQGDFGIPRYGCTASDDAKQLLELRIRSIQVVAAVDEEIYDTHARQGDQANRPCRVQQGVS